LSFSIDNFFDIKTEFPYDKEKEAFIEHMNVLKSMTVQESTLYKNWKQWNYDEYGMTQKGALIDLAQKQLWMPKDINDLEGTFEEIKRIRPIAVPVKQGDARSNDAWSVTRRLIHTMEFTANPGRNIKFYVKDEVTDKILGVICLGSDVISIKVRDKFIGWTKEDKLDNGLLNHTAICSTICSTQPFGYNFLGGKLIATMVNSKVVRDEWEKTYGQKLVGFSTTSLYGIHSMYNGIPHWRGLGESAGKIGLKPDDEFYDKWHDWIKENRKEEYEKKIKSKGSKSGPVTGIKQRILSIIFNEIGISQSKYQHGFKRGVFFSELYDNTRPFLRGEIKEDELVLKKRLDNDVESIVSWWQKKSLKRYFKLHEQNRLKPEMLFYADMIGKSWEEAKEKYLGEVGR
tara:strand:- start:171 stop:1373 length:1203 start_codon:yes stop_codon:yes gene_type:complete